MVTYVHLVLLFFTPTYSTDIYYRIRFVYRISDNMVFIINKIKGNRSEETGILNIL